MIQKSYQESKLGNLYIVATPVGNIKDITFRAVEILKTVDIIYAEDTRTSAVLLNSLEIRGKSLLSCNMNNEKKAKHKIAEELKSGKNIALISDRGTPLLSDPGYEVIKEAIDNKINVIAIPGASALLPALNMSGIEANKFLFYGFLNSKASIAKKELTSLKDLEYTIVFYESPHRFLKTLSNILETLGNRDIAVCREISKIYEEVFRGKVSEAIDFYESIKGEIVIIIEKSEKKIDIDFIMDEVKLKISKGMSSKEAVKNVSQKYGVSKNLLYNINERTKQ